MFPLHTKDFPATADALEHLLNESLREVLILPRDAVQVQEAHYPALTQIAVTLDRATVRPNPPKPRPSAGKTKPVLEVQQLSIRGEEISTGPAKVSLVLDAREVRLNSGTDENGDVVLGIDGATDGSVELSTTNSELEAAIGEIAKREAGKQGVTIEDVRLSLHETGPRSVQAETTLRARKLFFTAVVRIAGSLSIDDELNATLSGLQCSGEGAIGSMACGFLEPHLRKVEGRSFALMALALGDIRLRDVRLSANDNVTVRAEFGS